MSFFQFLNAIFSFFRQIMGSFQNVFSLLISNNLIIFSMCLGVFLFIIDYHFEVIGLLPRILGIINKESDKEFKTNTVTQTRSDYDKNTGVTTIYTKSHSKRRKVK